MVYSASSIRTDDPCNPLERTAASVCCAPVPVYVALALEEVPVLAIAAMCENGSVFNKGIVAFDLTYPKGTCGRVSARIPPAAGSVVAKDVLFAVGDVDTRIFTILSACAFGTRTVVFVDAIYAAATVLTWVWIAFIDVDFAISSGEAVRALARIACLARVLTEGTHTVAITGDCAVAAGV